MGSSEGKAKSSFGQKEFYQKDFNHKDFLYQDKQRGAIVLPIN
jgi:hypothetical protein